jgi:hypothetical protein
MVGELMSLIDRSPIEFVIVAPPLRATTAHT